MRFLKLGALFFAAALFAFACAPQNQTNNANTAAGNRTAAGNANTNATTGSATPAVTTAASPASDELADARRTYSTICIKCHKEDGRGGETDIEGKKIKAPDFTSDRMKKESDEEFIGVIKNGEQGDGMPAFKDRLSDEQIKNLVRLIRREFQGQK